jgi:hypothetical protein
VAVEFQKVALDPRFGPAPSLGTDLLRGGVELLRDEALH